MNLKRITFTLILVHVLALCICAQDTDKAILFQDEQPLSIRLSISLQDIKKNTSDSTYFPTMLYYKNIQSTWDSIPVGTRARGNFRRKHCFLPPMRIKIKKKDAKETLFAGTKSLKLVLPCQTTKGNDDLIMKEYICYKLYEPTTPYVFNTRLVDITLSDVGGKNIKTYQLKGFFIEDDDALAKRFHARVVEVEKLHPMLLQDTCSLRHDLFEYMIANTDFSTTFFHNMKIIQMKGGQYIPIAYDFDMSGFVNAPYATFNESIDIISVRERVYRGFCRDEKVAQYVRMEFINLEPKINEVINRYESYFDTKQFAGIKKYMNEFFVIIKNDGAYREEIIRPCRIR